MAIKTLYHKPSILRDFKLKPKYKDPRGSIAVQNKWNQGRKGTGGTREGESRGRVRTNEEGIDLAPALPKPWLQQFTRFEI